MCHASVSEIRISAIKSHDLPTTTVIGICFPFRSNISVYNEWMNEWMNENCSNLLFYFSGASFSRDYFRSRFKRDFADSSAIGSGGFGQVLKVKIIADVWHLKFHRDFRPPPQRLNSLVSKLDWLTDWLSDWLTDQFSGDTLGGSLWVCAEDSIRLRAVVALLSGEE